MWHKNVVELNAWQLWVLYDGKSLERSVFGMRGQRK